jgi:UPF0271 protein
MGARIDLNCDLGEGAGHDAELMGLITSANVACGAHAGDLATMRATLALARTHGVAAGAHPGFEDRENFGRRELALGPAEVRTLVERQIRALRELGPLTHVKAHGALYNLAARDARLAEAVVEAVRAVDAGLVRGLRVASEVFADRTYQRDGSLTPRARADALIHEEELAVTQVLRMVKEGVVRATDGTEVSIQADTVCLHGDGAHAVAFARRLGMELKQAGVDIRGFGP